jgi:solute:Na+ symporter, SSS family
MAVGLSIIAGYLLLMLGIGFLFRRVSSRNTVEFFLAGRGLPRILLFCTMAATNFSAFTIFGLSGAGYRIGYGFFPVMAFGTGFMALSFLVVGTRINALSRERGYVTPADFIADRYRSPLLKKFFSVILILFTLPYISIQAMASGRSLETLVGIPYWAGALLITGVSVLYVVLGGMRSDAWTDVVQGVFMLGFTLAAFILIARRSGGFVAANLRSFEEAPRLFSRPGADGSLVPGVWVGYMVLWLFADPMFPQIFQRFMAARDPSALRATAILYPIVTTVLFFLTISIGVMGRAIIPGLSPAQSDSIFPMLLERTVGGTLATLLLTGGMAALMSTLDSQLLSLSSMVTLDFGRLRRREVLVERLVLSALGAAGFLIALRPPRTILDFVNRTSFYGFAALAPAVAGGLLWRRATREGAAASILVGETMVVLSFFDVLRWQGVLPVIPVLIASISAFVAVSLLTPARGGWIPAAPSSPKRPGAWAAVFAAFFVLSNDFWSWGHAPVLVLGVPLWLLYSAVLTLALSGAFALFSRAEGRS